MASLADTTRLIMQGGFTRVTDDLRKLYAGDSSMVEIVSGGGFFADDENNTHEGGAGAEPDAGLSESTCPDASPRSALGISAGAANRHSFGAFRCVSPGRSRT